MTPPMKITAKDFGLGVLVKLQNPDTKLCHVAYLGQSQQPPKFYNNLGVVESADCVKASVHLLHVNHIKLNEVHRVYYNREGYVNALQVLNAERLDVISGFRKAIVSSCYEEWDNEDDNDYPYQYNLETIRLFTEFDPNSFESPKELKQKWADLLARGWR